MNDSIILEACDALSFTKSLESKSVALIITSPPYNLGKEYETKVTLELYIQQQKEIVTECIRVLKDNGSICWQVGNYVNDGEIFPLDIILYHVFKDLGLKLRNRIIWHFGHGLHCKKRFSGRHESILWFTKSDNYTFNLDAVRVPQKYSSKKYYKGNKKGELSCNPLGKNPSDVWEITNVKHNHPEKTEHPCQYPLDIVNRLVLALSNPGDVVFDPFVGSGTTVLSAVLNNRKGYGCDTLSKYINLAKTRIYERLSIIKSL